MSWRPKRILSLAVFGKTSRENEAVFKENGTRSLIALMCNSFFFNVARSKGKREKIVKTNMTRYKKFVKVPWIYSSDFPILASEEDL